MLRERCPGRPAHEQRPAERVLQPTHLQAHGRLGAADLSGGCGEALGVADGNECLQKVDVHGGHMPGKCAPLKLLVGPVGGE